MRLSAVVTFLAGTSHAEPRVVDGDTLEQGDVTYRMYGIDAPEFGEKCAKAGGGTWQCGKEGVVALLALVEGKDVSCVAISEDGYGRTIATCFADGADVGAAMV